MLRRNVGVVGALALVAAFSSAALAGGECCDKAKASDGWCGDCKMGFVAGITMKSRALYDALMGKEVTAEQASKCGGCQAAFASNGTCNECHVAFANHKMYRSPFAARLAMGKPIDRKALCKECQEHCAKATAEEMAKHSGWCDACKAGFVNGKTYTSKESFQQAMDAHTLLTKAAEAKCDGCAVAMVCDGACGECKVAFKDGKMTAKP